MTERTYALTKVRSGDWLLPSNDGEVVWRIRKYWEDGSAVRGTWPNEKPIYGEFWWVCWAPMSEVEGRDPRSDDVRWRDWSSSHRTRGDAIEEALTSNPVKR
jgi:hypothetical protein